jgi:exosortase
VEHRLEVTDAGKALSFGWKVRLLTLGALLAALGTFVYAATLGGLALSILHREGSSHGLFVPFISAWFCWRQRERLRQTEVGFSPVPGILLIGAGFVLLFLAQGRGELALSVLSFLTVTCGLVVLILGTGVFRVVSFPLLFLVAMIPLPEAIYDAIGEWVRAATTTGSVRLMQAIQLPAYREGYTIQLPNAKVFVAMSCSGIRYLLSYIVFSLPYAFLVKKSIKARIFVIAVSVPVAIIAGVLRLSSIYLAVYFIGPSMAAHRPHIILSWSVFVGVLGLVISGDRYFSRMWEKRRRRTAGILE